MPISERLSGAAPDYKDMPSLANPVAGAMHSPKAPDSDNLPDGAKHPKLAIEAGLEPKNRADAQ